MKCNECIYGRDLYGGDYGCRNQDRWKLKKAGEPIMMVHRKKEIEKMECDKGERISEKCK